MYHPQPCTDAWRDARSLGLQQTAGPPVSGAQMRHRQPTLQGRCPRLRILTVGGLSAELYDILVTWLHEQAVGDVVVLQEMHWGLGKIDGQWTVGSWHFLASADPSARYSGVCICISARLASAEDITHSTWVPGRLLHARIMGFTVPLDIIAAYQWVLQDRQPEVVKRNRSRFWAQLSRVFNTIDCCWRLQPFMRAHEWPHGLWHLGAEASAGR